MIKAIFSINTKGFMGKNNNLIVKDKEDLGNFKKITENHTIVMGRKTWESLGNKPLPNRNNVILSESLESKTILEESGYYTRFVNSGKGVQDILDEDKENNRDTFIIGGSSILELFSDLIDEWIVSLFYTNSEIGDTKLGLSASKYFEESIPFNSVKFKNFEEFEHLLKECQKDIKEQKRRLIPSVESQLREGMFCVLDGILLYIHKIFQPIRGNSNKLNRRTILIFENGTQSNMLLRSLGKRLKDNGKMVTDLNIDLINEEDNKSGYIYILESKSQDEKISSIKNLYKIGYSTIPVKDRIKNAINEPTYLMAPVRIVAVYETYNMNTQKFEQLIHKFFGKVCLNLDIFGNDNKRYTPREWFIVPLEVIEQTIDLIINGEIVNYRYDEVNEKLN